MVPFFLFIQVYDGFVRMINSGTRSWSGSGQVWRSAVITPKLRRPIEKNCYECDHFYRKFWLCSCSMVKKSRNTFLFKRKLFRVLFQNLQNDPII